MVCACGGASARPWCWPWRHCRASRPVRRRRGTQGHPRPARAHRQERRTNAGAQRRTERADDRTAAGAAAQPARPECQLEAARAEMAKLRGSNEQLLREVSEVQRKQSDISQAMDDRLRKLEPQKVTLDGREFMADPEERRQYDEAFALLRAGDFDEATRPSPPSCGAGRAVAMPTPRASGRAMRCTASATTRKPSAPFAASWRARRTIRTRPKPCWPLPTAKPR